MILHSQAAWPLCIARSRGPCGSPGGRGQVTQSCGVRAWGDCPGSAGGEGPVEVAWPGLGELPAGCLLGRVMPSAQRREVAFAGAPALVIGHRVVIVASSGGPPAA